MLIITKNVLKSIKNHKIVVNFYIFYVVFVIFPVIFAIFGVKSPFS